MLFKITLEMARKFSISGLEVNPLVLFGVCVLENTIIDLVALLNEK